MPLSSYLKRVDLSDFWKNVKRPRDMGVHNTAQHTTQHTTHNTARMHVRISGGPSQYRIAFRIHSSIGPSARSSSPAPATHPNGTSTINHVGHRVVSGVFPFRLLPREVAVLPLRSRTITPASIWFPLGLGQASCMYNNNLLIFVCSLSLPPSPSLRLFPASVTLSFCTFLFLCLFLCLSLCSSCIFLYLSLSLSCLSSPDWLKFAIVREPAERLLSCFLQKCNQWNMKGEYP